MIVLFAAVVIGGVVTTPAEVFDPGNPKGVVDPGIKHDGPLNTRMILEWI